MPECPFKLNTNYSNSLCALRYRNAQLETCINPSTKPGFKDEFCKSCSIGKKLNDPNNPANIEVSRVPQGKTINTDSNISIDSKREYELDGVSLFAVINLKGKNTNAPRLANRNGEIVAKICSVCLKPKWLKDYYTPDRPSICKECFNKRPKKKKITIVEDKEYITTPAKKVLPKIEETIIDNQNTVIPVIDNPSIIIPEINKEKTDNSQKIRSIINDAIELRIMNVEKYISEIIDKQLNDLKRKILLEVGTALLMEAKK